METQTEIAERSTVRLSAADVEHFRRRGFLVVPSVMAAEEIARYRERLKEIFDSPPQSAYGDVSDIRMDVISRYEPLAALFFSERILGCIRQLLGEQFVLLPETSISNSQYGGWHTDTTTATLWGHRFRDDPGFSLLNAAFYFQENGAYGGGIDVVPGSHLKEDVFLSNIQRQNEAYRRRALLRAAKRSLRALVPGPLLKLRRRLIDQQSMPLKQESSQPQQHTVANAAGDLVLFDLRIYHKASWSALPPPLPPQARKFAYFVICGANNETTRKYRDFLRYRSQVEPGYAYLRNHQYPDWLQRRARGAGVALM